MHLSILNAARKPTHLAYIKREFPLDHLAIKELVDWGMLKLIRNNPAAILVQTHEDLRDKLVYISNFDMILNDWEARERRQVTIHKI